MPVIRCPHCDDRIEIEDDWYGRRIACPSCDTTFTPERERGGDRPRRGYDDDRHRRRRYDDDPPKKKGNAALWIILTLLGVFVVLPCAGCIGFFAWVGTAKESFNDPWADNSVGGSPPAVAASFPRPPVSKFLNVTGSTGGEVVGYSNVNDGNKLLDVEFGVGYLDFPPGTRDPLTTHYPAIRQEVERLFMDNPVVTPKVTRETTTTVNGYPTKEAVYTEETGDHVLQVVHLNDRPAGQPTRLVVVIVGGPHIKPDDKQKFLNSVKIGKK